MAPTHPSTLEPGTLEPWNLVRSIRRIILGLVAFGIIGMSTELMLVGHHEDARQMIPLVLAGTGLVMIAWVALAESVLALRIFQFVMLLYVGAGIIGISLHYQANAATARTDHPSLRGRDLFWTIVASTAPPALSPGVMAQLGLLGLLFTYRHPRLEGDEWDVGP